MAVAAATSGSAFSQLQLQQAKREVERAELTARTLRVRAQEAEREAYRAQENARSLRMESSQADQEAGRKRTGISSADSMQRVNSGFDEIRLSIKEYTDSAAKTTAAPQPVVNTQGQTTGTVVNTTA